MTESSEISAQTNDNDKTESEDESKEELKAKHTNDSNPLSLRILHMLVQFIMASLFTTSAFLISLQAKQLWYQYQYNAALTLSEKSRPYYVHHFGNVWYRFSAQSSEHFEFSEGRLKVNTSLYAF